MSDYSEDISRAPVIFFLGAGASVPLGLPTTVKFWRDIKERPIEPPEAHALLLDLEKELGGDGVIDIEVVLDRLLEWETQAALLAKHSVSKGLKNVQDSLADNLARKAHQAILSRVVDTYTGDHLLDNPAQLWSPIFEELWDFGIRTVPVFTTNYDTIIEQATLFSADLLRTDRFNAEYDYEESGKYNHSAPEGYLSLRDGFKLGHREFAHWDKWDFHGYDECPDQLTIALFKMHGSVTWSFIHDELEPNVESIGGDDYDPPDDAVGLLPPGVGRNPLGRTTAVHYPYLSKSPVSHDIFWVPKGYLLSCLADCKLCVAIGSSFRDKDILEILVEGAMFRKGYHQRTNKQGQNEWTKPGKGDPPMLSTRDEMDDLRILTIAPNPDHLILQKQIEYHPENPPIKVIPFETMFDHDATKTIMSQIRALIGDCPSPKQTP